MKRPKTAAQRASEAGGEAREELDFNRDESASDYRPNIRPTKGGRAAADDLTPETLLREERSGGLEGLGGSVAADTDLRTVDENEIGEGYGQDEAELARSKPLDGEKPA